MSYTENLILKSRECDLEGRWKPSAVLEAMQETAGAHCDALGVGRGTTVTLGLVWVLSRVRVELERLPRIGEAYSLETFALPGRHLFFPRAHIFRDAKGEIIGSARALWLLMDLKTRRMAAHPYVTERLPLEDRPVPAGMPGTVRPLGTEAAKGLVTPVYCDFDQNGHVNNARYMDWCWNALGFEGLRGMEAAAFEVNYDREVLPGEAVETSLTREGNAFAFCGEVGGSRCFGVRAELRQAR